MSLPHFLRIPLLAMVVMGSSLAWSLASAHSVDHHQPHHLRELSATDTNDEVRTLIRAFRQTGDDHHLDRAWSLLEPVLTEGTQDATVLVDAATVAQARHDFDTALKLIDQALRIQRNFDQAWLLDAAIHLVRGDARQAERACNELRNVPLLVMITCRARVAIVRGNHAEASRRLTALLGSPALLSPDPDLLAWSLSVAGDAAAPIDAEQAIDLYERSLHAAESAQVRAALVDVLLAENRLENADRTLEAGTDALPLDVRRMIVAKRLGRESAATDIAAADHEFQHWIAEQDWLHAREMARFYLDVVERPALARRLADINLATQREPEDLLLASRTREL